MFKIDPSPTFPGDVRVPMPDGTVQTLKLVFKHKRTGELNDFMRSAATLSDAEMIDGIVHDVKDAGDIPVKDYMLSVFDAYPSASRAVFETWLDLLVRGRQKN